MLDNNLQISNHICYVAFLREILKVPFLAKDFDSFRELRNAIPYQGKTYDLLFCETIYGKMVSFYEKLPEIYSISE